MANKIMAFREDFLEKSKILENARIELKKEFVGIEQVIDDVIENVRSWYILSAIQDKPVVINLWGLTGTGKTSLVLRLMELINYTDKTYRFDLGEKDGRRSFRNALNDLCENPDDSPIAIILDELQHARTVKGIEREEIENDKNRMIWEIIDSGKVSYVEWKSGLWIVEKLAKNLNEILNAGVKVKNGLVTHKKNLFMEELNIIQNSNEPLLFIQENEYEEIISLAGEEMGLTLKSDLAKHLLKLDGPESISFLYRVVNIATKPKVKNFSKAIVFVLGNIDEAYTMSGNYNIDISADEFYEMSLKITIPDIKRALRGRFRDEQIARLGNIHIIYPALNSSAFYKLIRLELSRIEKSIYEMLHLKIEFQDSLVNEIYKEGVYPTQGARPLFTTIHQMVKSKLSNQFNIILKFNLSVDRLVLSVLDEQLVCEFYENKVLKHVHSEPITYNLEKLRKPRKDDQQAIAAVHEAGHAVLSIALMKTVPELIVSVTSDSDSMGFMISKNEKNYISKLEILPKIAIILGGIVAEELIFGENYLTSGGTSDIRKATENLMILYKKQGFSGLPITYGKSINEEKNVYHQIEEMEEEVKATIIKAKDLAKDEILKHKELLLAIADILSDRVRIEKDEIIRLVQKHSKIKLPSKPNNYYRNVLKAKVETRKIFDKCQHRTPITLNKGK